MSPNCTYHDRVSAESAESPVVFIVDGNRSVRDALAQVILSAGYHPRAAASAEEFLAYPRTTSPGCMLLELALPGSSGLDLQRLIIERIELPIIFMSEHISVETAVRAVKNGAFGVFTKPLVHDVLLSDVYDAIDCSRAALRHLAHLQRLRKRYETLTAREREVMSLVVVGRLNKQIGSELGIAEGTVKAHRSTLMHKMRAQSLAELIAAFTELRARTARPPGGGPGLKYVGGAASSAALPRSEEYLPAGDAARGREERAFAHGKGTSPLQNGSGLSESTASA